MTKAGQSSPPAAAYDGNGITAEWRGPHKFTRTENRYGIFFRNPGPGWTTCKTNFGTVEAAIAAAEALPVVWRPDCIWDFVSNECVHVFPGVAA